MRDAWSKGAEGLGGSSWEDEFISRGRLSLGKSVSPEMVQAQL